MKTRNCKLSVLFHIIVLTILFSCGENNRENKPVTAEPAEDIKQPGQTLTVFRSDKIRVQQLSDHVYQHISFLQTRDFGKVGCNGMIVIKNNEAIVFDTPADNESAELLVLYLKDSMKVSIKAVIPTHFHEDCVGGIETFAQYNIPVYASARTKNLLVEKNRKMPEVEIFTDSLELPLGAAKVSARYFGEGHTSDNIIGFFADDQVMFGGCLVKEINASKGNLADANTRAWPETIRKIKQAYPSVKTIVPGHGKSGGAELLDYTIRLFQ